MTYVQIHSNGQKVRLIQQLNALGAQLVPHGSLRTTDGVNAVYALSGNHLYSATLDQLVDNELIDSWSED